MSINTAVRWVDSVKESYGDNVESVMESHVQSHMQGALLIAMNTQMFGLQSDDPHYLTEFANAGGDVEYLEHLTKAFINVRSKVFGL